MADRKRQLKNNIALSPNVINNKWEDSGFIEEMERRVKELEDGIDKGATWEEIKERVKKRLKCDDILSST